LPSAAAYFERKRAIADELERRLASRLRSLDRVTVTLNALDSEPGTISSVYVTVNGLSAESADSGAVGRGNRVNGLIPLLRPRGAEAAAGKNPYSHVGKIYSVLTQKIAEELVASVEGVAEATVWMCSRIGAPISEPEQVSVEVRTAAGTVVTDVAPAIETHIGRRLAGIRTFCDELAGGLHPVC
jgi:S-adenosylmethionine synthetase